MPSYMGQLQSSTPDTDLQLRIPAKNVGGSTVTPYGIVEIVDTVYDDVFGEMYLEVRRPTADNVKTIAICTECAITVNGYGYVTVTFPGWVLYDSADGVPSLNEQWGPASGTYKAKKGKIGFLAVPMSSGDDPPGTDLSMFWLEVCRA